MRSTSLWAVGVALAAAVLGCGKRVEWLYPPEPRGPSPDSRTLAVWDATLRYYQASSSAFDPIGKSRGDRVDTLPIALQAGGLDRPTPWPPRWLAQLVADSTIDGICGSYIRIRCPEYVRARWLRLGEVTFTAADTARAQVHLSLHNLSLCGRGNDYLSWSIEFALVNQAAAWTVVSHRVFGMQDTRCEVEVRRAAP